MFDFGRSVLLRALALLLPVHGSRAADTQPTAAPTTEVTTAPTTAPTSQPAVSNDPDPTGNNGAGNSLITPAAGLPGWPTNPDGSPKTTLTNDDNVALHAKAFYSINFTWTLVCGYLVMFMQAGFALVETGLTRGKNVAHTMSMNFLVYALGMFGFFVCGFAFMCGGANGANGALGGPAQLGTIPTLDQMWSITIAGKPWGLCGHTGFFLTGKGYDAAAAVWFLFEMVFMDTTATIVTGACAERWNFKSFFVFSILIGAILYPIFGCWVWGGGWLAQLGKNYGLGNGACDYAGSGVVHLQGGALAFITAYLIGPRLGKYDKSGKVVNPISAHNVPMVLLGCFILAFGWFGFNPGSSLAASDNRIGIVATNTMIAGMSATLSSCMYMWLLGPTKKPDPCMMGNGILAGLVAITAPSGFVSPLGAFIIGLVAGVLVVLSCFFFDKMRIDDPVGAISVHGTCGAWGVLSVGLFADGNYAGYNGISHGVTGLFCGGGMGQFASQAIEVVANIVWNVGLGGILFYLVGLCVGGNRVSARVEIAGLDMPEMGVVGYDTTKLILPEQVSEADLEDIKAGKKLEPTPV